MKNQTPQADKAAHNIHLLPRWITSSRGEGIENAAVSSGGALALLDVVLQDVGGTLPQGLLRGRLALEAALGCLKLEGRFESVSSLRDAVCLARAGDALGPAGEMYSGWRKFAALNLDISTWRHQLTQLMPGPVAETMPDLAKAGEAPVSKAGQVLAQVLQSFPQQEAAALMLADVVLARGLGWTHPVPVLAAHLKRADLRAIAKGHSDPALSVHLAVVAGCDAAIRTASDLSRRAARFGAVTPKIRTKGKAEAIALFLNHDAVSPSTMLSPRIKGTSVAMTGRAARRFCDRLVDLGVARELTGRATFRLYGL